MGVKDDVRLAVLLDPETLRLLDLEVERMECDRPGLRVTRTSAIRVFLLDGLRGAREKKAEASKSADVDKLRDLISEMQAKTAAPSAAAQTPDPSLCEPEDATDLCRKCNREMTLQDFRRGRKCLGKEWFSGIRIAETKSSLADTEGAV